METKEIMREKFLPYGHQLIDDEDIKAVIETLKSDYLTTGSKVKEFEDKLANYCGVKYAVVVSSGTAALHCAYYAAGIKQGDEFITTPITFMATIAAGVFCGANPVLIDVSIDNINMNPYEMTKIKDKSKVKAIVPVDFAGHPVNLDAIRLLAKLHNWVVIEDACHALGAEYKGKKIGSISDMTVFSFHPVKVLTTGEGGAVLTNNQEYYEKLLKFRNHNIVKGSHYWEYEIQDFGLNYRLTDIQCALGVSQMNRLDSFIERRRYIAKCYNEAFKDCEKIITPIEYASVKSAYHLYVIQLNSLDRNKVIQQLVDKNIGAHIHYIPIHYHPCMKRFGYKKGDFPIAEKYYNRCLSLPLFPSMTDKDIQDVINTLKEVVNE